MKKVLRVLFNIIWVITGGLLDAIWNIFMGILSIVTIIPLIIGVPKVYFKLVPLSFAPFGKKVELHFGKAPVRNVLYWIFGGFLNAISMYIAGIAMCCTIIGIPWGLQQFKFAKYYLAPFGAEVVSKE